MTSIRAALILALVFMVPPAAPHAAPQAAPRARVVLVGDSTVTSEKGWGTGFCELAHATIECIDEAASGRSSKSYIDEGRWRDALALKGNYYLVQFGHNDEPGKGPERETDPETTYWQNMARYVDEARAIGATPILVTSLTRRRFDATGHLVPNLMPYVDAVKALAAEKHVALIDLHARSVEAAERMGDAAWGALSPRDDKGDVDRTHLNAEGGALIGSIVARELGRAVPSLAPHFGAGSQPVELTANAVVASDGTGQYATVQEAINAVPQNTTPEKRWVIYVKPGRYREVVYVQREKRFVTLIGKDPAITTITYDLHANMTGLDGKPIGTFRTPTMTVDADDFSVESLTIENAAGPVGQALALRVDGDRAMFRNCRFLGWQDTIFLDRGRQYFEDVFVQGHVDFIFGGATAYFERPRIHVLRNGYITAPSTPPAERFGLVFAHGTITGEPGVSTYLGRPWRDYGASTFVEMTMSDAVRPEGWHNWDKPEREKTARFAEYGNRGPGANPSARVAWRKTLSDGDAAALTPAAVLGGADRWNPVRASASASDPRVIQLWPEGVPDAKPNGGEERVENERVSNVQRPSLTVYPAPAATATGTAVIICPGGGYQRLAIEKEGTAIAKLLNGIGVSAFVLRYRMVEYGHPAPLQDVLRAVRLLRSQAAEFGIRGDRIGVWGASAGGHLAASAATLFDAPEGRTGATLDAISARPDFVALLYPVITMHPPFAHEGSRKALLGETPAAALLAHLSLESQVKANTPPVFLVHTGQDTSVPVENSLMFYAALRKAGVPAELHVFERGAHGFGLAPDLGPTSEWPMRLEQWLRSHGWLDQR
jgi:pectinesterase